MANLLTRYADNILAKQAQNRLLALDVLRGITITAMILVNNPGSWSYVYAPLLHAKWHGWTITDLIFPFFIFMVGMSIAIVHNRESKRQTPHHLLVKSASIRAAKLFAFGLMLALCYYNFRDQNFSWIDDRLLSIRVLGVLQRIAVVYFITFLLVLVFRTRGLVLIATFILFAYYLLMTAIPYSDSLGNQYQGLYLYGNNLSAYLDHHILGVEHNYYPNAKPFSFDPEGILSTFPAVASCIIGVITARYLNYSDKPIPTKVLNLLIGGGILISFAYLWHQEFPINKALWSPAFVLLTAGWALISLAILMFVIDHKQVKRWCAPFVVFGANAIFFYLFAGVLARILIIVPIGEQVLKSWLFKTIYQPVFGNFNGSLMFALSILAVSYVVMQWLFVRRIIFKV